jgi:CHAD domain-containing protein
MATSGGLYGPFRKRLDALTHDFSDIHTENTEAVHHMRVASRRLRELLPLLPIDEDEVGKLGRHLKRVTRQLGRVRELDVLWLAIHELGRDPRYSKVAVNVVGASVQAARTAARERLRERLSEPKLERLANRLERAAKHLQWADEHHHRRAHSQSPAWMSVLESSVARRASDVQSAIEHTGATYAAVRLHEVRIALKKLRYAIELRSETHNSQASDDLTSFKEMQEILGRLHDLEVLIEWARQVQTSLPPTSWRAIESFVRRLDAECRHLHGRFMHDRGQMMTIVDRIAGAASGSLPVHHAAV